MAEEKIKEHINKTNKETHKPKKSLKLERRIRMYEIMDEMKKGKERLRLGG